VFDGSPGVSPTRQPPGSARISKRRLLAAAAVLVVLVFPVVMLTPRGSATTKTTVGAPAPAVAVATARSEDVPVLLEALGTVTPYSTVTLRSQISGYLVSVAATEGQIIHKGDFLAQVDERPYRASLAQIEGQLIRDEALLKNAKLDLARYQRLIAQDSTSHQLADTAEATVAQFEGTVRSDRAQLRIQRLNVEYCRIAAPTSGRVGLRQVDPGNFVQPNDSTGLMVITQLQPISVIFILPQAQLGTVLQRFNSGARLAVTAFDSENARLLGTGTLESIDNQVDTSTGTVKLRASFANTDSALFPNQFVNVRLRVDTVKNAVTIPVAAVRHGASGDYVFVVGTGGGVHSQKIETGLQYEDRTVVTVGLAPAERVVTDGVNQVVDGMRVLASATENTRP
jgi:membrane fusion protein, multidrug efflux system